MIYTIEKTFVTDRCTIASIFKGTDLVKNIVVEYKNKLFEDNTIIRRAQLKESDCNFREDNHAIFGREVIKILKDIVECYSYSIIRSETKEERIRYYKSKKKIIK